MDPDDPLSVASTTSRSSINGKAYTTTYANETLTGTTPAGRHWTASVDTQGRPLTLTRAGQSPLSLTYDARGRLETVSQGTRTTTFTYDPGSGQVAAITDPLNRTVSFAYDEANRVTIQTLPDTRVIGFGYDDAGNVTRIVPPGRPDHTFDYTPVDLQQKYVAPATDPPVSSRETIYTYNEDRQLEQIDRPDGKQVTLTYDDPAGRLTGMTLDGATRTFSYEAPAKKVSAITGSDVVGLQFTYEGPLLKGETWVGPEVTGAVSVDYNEDLRVGSQTAAGLAVDFGYDDDGLLTQAGDLTLARNETTGFLNGSTLDNIEDEYTYTTFGEVETYEARVSGGAILYRVEYTRYPDGRIHTKTEQVGSDPETEEVYEYDAAGRLADVRRRTEPDTTYEHVAHYEYDSNGNRVPDADEDTVLTFTAAGALIAAEYDEQDRLLSATHGPVTREYTYSDNGELATKTEGAEVTTYTYDPLGSLRSVVLPNSDEIEYVIDAKNRRVGKKLNGTLVRRWLYDDQLRIAAELDGSGALVSRFVYGARPNVPEYMVRDSVTYRIISDHLGSSRLVVKVADGTVSQRMDYDAFGNVLPDANAGFQPFGFAGGLYDPHTRLVRFGARDYDATSGRWLSADPVRFNGGGANLYTYVTNDPINRIDPFGLRDYSQAETAQFLEQARNDASGLFGKLWAFNHHRPRGDFDFKYHESETDPDFFTVDGRLYNASEFGNYLAGYSGVYASSRVCLEGYWGVRAGGILVDYTDNEFWPRLGLPHNENERWDWDDDSRPEIDAGARRALRELGWAK